MFEIPFSNFISPQKNYFFKLGNEAIAILNNSFDENFVADGQGQPVLICYGNAANDMPVCGENALMVNKMDESVLKLVHENVGRPILHPAPTEDVFKTFEFSPSSRVEADKDKTKPTANSGSCVKRKSKNSSKDEDKDSKTEIEEQEKEHWGGYEQWREIFAKKIGSLPWERYLVYFDHKFLGLFPGAHTAIICHAEIDRHKRGQFVIEHLAKILAERLDVNLVSQNENKGVTKTSPDTKITASL